MRSDLSPWDRSDSGRIGGSDLRALAAALADWLRGLFGEQGAQLKAGWFAEAAQIGTARSIRLVLLQAEALADELAA
jgi:hypothetical protein